MESGSPASNNHDHQGKTIGVRSLPLDNTIRDEIKNFDNLRENITEKLKLENWIAVTSYNSQTLYIFSLNKKLNGNLSIRNTISIDIDLIVKVFDDINENTIFNLKLYVWEQLQTLIDQLSNVKREYDLDFECILETQQNYGFNDFYGNKKEKDTAFEFCATNAETDTYETHEPLGEPLGLNTVNEMSDSLLQVKSELPNPVNPQSIFIQDSLDVCSKCGKEFDERAKLILHMRLHQPKFCSICNESFTGRRDRHFKRHLRKEYYQCLICASNYRNKISLEKHMQLKHSARDEFYCDICKDGKNFKSKILIESHMKNKHFVEHFQIEWIRASEERMRKQYAIQSDGENKTFNSEKGVSHSDAKQPLSTCTTYDKEFYTQSLTSQNTTQHKVKTHVCEMCGTVYKHFTSLREHISMKHSTDEGFSCDICRNEQVYRSRTHLKRHLARHAKNILKKSRSHTRNKLYKCGLCNEQFPSTYTLKSHTTLKHNDGNENATQYECKICYKKFGMQSTLNVHQKLHTGNLHICHQCGQSFKHPNYLRKHLNRHKGVKKKECTICDKQYAYNVDLRLHMKKVHGIIVTPIRSVTKEIVQ